MSRTLRAPIYPAAAAIGWPACRPCSPLSPRRSPARGRRRGRRLTAAHGRDAGARCRARRRRARRPAGRGAAPLGATGRAEEIVTIPTLGLADVPARRRRRARTAPATVPRLDRAVRRAVGAAVRAVPHARRDISTSRSTSQPAPRPEGALLGAYTFTDLQVGPTSPRCAGSPSPAEPREPNPRGNAAGADHGRRRHAHPRSGQHPAQRSVSRDVRRAVRRPAGRRPGSTVEILRRAGARARRLRRHPRRRQRLDAPPAPASGSATVRARRAGSRWSARGITFDSGGLNLKTGRHELDEVGHGRRRRHAWPRRGVARLERARRGHRDRPDGREHAVGQRPTGPPTSSPLRDGTHGRDGRHRRRGSADPGRRASSVPVRTSRTALIETSTLTGAQLVALGTRVIGAMGEPGVARPGRPRRPGTPSARRCGRCRCPTSCAAGSTPPVADLIDPAGRAFGGMLVAGRVPRRVRAERAALGPPRHRRAVVQHPPVRSTTRRRAAPAPASGRSSRPSTPLPCRRADSPLGLAAGLRASPTGG